jgi:outer membrane protein TolC
MRSVRVLPAVALLLLASSALADPPVAEPLSAKLAAVVGRPGGLTADEVARRAASTSFEIKARQSDVEAAAAGVSQALVGYFPRLALTARYTRLSKIDPPVLGDGSLVGTTAAPGPLPPGAPLVSTGPLTLPVVFDNVLLQAGITVPLSDYLLRTSQSYSAASHSEQGAALNAQATRLKTASDARLAYYSWVRARLSVVVAEQALAQADGHLRDAKNAVAAGTASPADALRVDSQRASAELLLMRTQNLADLLTGQLRIAMHDDANRQYEIGESVAGASDAQAVTTSLADLVAEALDHRLEIRALDETAYSLKDQAKAARSVAYPRIDGFGDVIYANPNPRIFPQTDQWKATWDVGVQLTWTPNDVGTGVSQARMLEAKAAATEAGKQAMLDGLRVEVMQAWQAAREADAALATTARGLASAEEGYRVRRDLFLNGRATSAELTDAETDLTRARLEAVNAQIDTRSARVRLMHAVGRDVPRR